MPYMKTVKLNRGIWKLILKMISNEKISRLQRCSAKCVKHSMKWSVVFKMTKKKND